MPYPTYAAAQAAYRASYTIGKSAYSYMSSADLETEENHLLGVMPNHWQGTLDEVRLAFVQAELETRQEVRR